MKIKLTSEGKFIGYVDGEFTRKEAVSLCEEMDYVFLDVDDSYDMEVVEG